MRHAAAEKIWDLSQPILVCYVVLLVAIPSELVFGPLGAAGTPAGVLAVLLVIWWVASVAVSPRSVVTQSNPVKWLVTAFGAAIVLSYVFGMSRAVSTGEEVSSADRALLALGGWCGVALVVIDGTGTRRRLDVVLQTLAVGGGFIAALGLLQFFFDLDLAHVIHLPGLTANGAYGELIARSSFRRVTGTTSHPIEFGVVLASIAPLAIHYGRFADDRRLRITSWAAVLLIATAIPLSIARSGIIGAGVALLVMFFTWPRHLRSRVIAAIAAGMVGCSFAVPGLLGTFKSLFLNASSDPSTSGRTDDYGPVLDYVRESPVVGRGFGTFIPSLYRTLDNQYLGLLVETGIVGLLCTVLLLVGSGVVATVVRHHSRVERERDLAQSLVAGVAVMGVNAATFDLFGFSMSVGVLFVLLGAIGSMSAHSRPGAVRLRPLSRRALAGTTALALATVGGSAAMARLAEPEYDALATVIVAPADLSPALAVSVAGRTSTATSVLLRVVESPESRSSLERQGVESFDIAVGDGSLMMGTDRMGTGGSVITVLSRGSSAGRAEAGLSLVTASLRSDFAVLQREVGVSATDALQLQTLTTNPAFPVRGRPSRTVAGGLGLAIILVSCCVNLLQRRRREPDSVSAAQAPTRAFPVPTPVS